MWARNGKCCLPRGPVSLRGSRPEMSGCLGKRWMTAVQRKWFRSLFQILNQPLLGATTVDINCDTCDFLLPAQIMIVWTTGPLAPSPQRLRKRNWLWAEISQWMLRGTHFYIEFTCKVFSMNVISLQYMTSLLILSCTSQWFYILFMHIFYLLLQCIKWCVVLLLVKAREKLCCTFKTFQLLFCFYGQAVFRKTLR